MIKEGFIICESTYKEGFLNNLDGIYNYTFLSLDELLKKLLFDVKKEGVLKVSLKYNIKPEIAKEYIKYLKYIDLFFDNPKLQKLTEIYNFLLDENMVVVDEGYKHYLRERPITILGYVHSKEIDFLLSILDNNGYKYEYIENEKLPNITRDIYEFDNIIDESRFVFDSIKKLLDRGININNIKIANYSSDYDFIFHRLENFYKIPINFNCDKNILSTSIVRYLFSILGNYNDYYKLIEDLKTRYSNSLFLKKIISIINSYHLYNYIPKETKDVLIMELKNTKYDRDVYDNGIMLVDLGSPAIKDNDYIFVIGFNQGSIPIIYEDNGYLNDEILDKMGLDISTDLTILCENVLIHNLNINYNYIISYKISSPFNSYLPSSIIKKMNYKIIEGKKSFGINENEDKIIIGDALDQYYKYGVIDEDMKNSIYDIGYLTYDNSFKGISDKNLKAYLPETIKLSYSSISNYAKCGFRYLMSSILCMDKYESGIDAHIGTYCHKILELYYKGYNYLESKSIAINELLQNKKDANYGVDTPLTNKELFFINSMDSIISEVIEFNKTHEKNITSVKNEFKIEIPYDNNKLLFKGYVDKILVEESDDIYITIVDYKTGSDAPSLDNINYGFNLQLPLYLFMIRKSNEFINPIVIGFYLQKIGPKDYPNFKLYGFTNSNEDVMKHLGDTIDKSEYVRGLSRTANGSINAKAKLISEDEMNKLSDLVEKVMLETYTKIRQGKFDINPKVDGNINLGCEYCKFKDVCYVKEENKEYIKHTNFQEGDDLYGVD